VTVHRARHANVSKDQCDCGVAHDLSDAPDALSASSTVKPHRPRWPQISLRITVSSSTTRTMRLTAHLPRRDVYLQTGLFRQS
jgi:hypothetical protein